MMRPILLPLVFALAAVAQAAPVTPLAPGESLAPVEGTGLLVLGFTTGGLYDLRFGTAKDGRTEFVTDEVKPGQQIVIWRLPAGRYCLDRYSTRDASWVLQPDQRICFAVVAGAVNHPGSIRMMGETLALSTFPDLLYARLHAQRPELLKPGFRWQIDNSGTDDPVLADRRANERDARLLGLAAVYGPQSPYSALSVRRNADKLRKNGRGNAAKALAAYQRAAELGDPRAAAIVCQQFDLGIGVEEDPVTAVAYCRRGAARGDELASWLLARMQKGGRGGLTPDAAEEATLMRAVTDLGELGYTVFADSWGVTDGAGDYRDPEAAFRLAQAMYDGEARGRGAYALAHFYANGIGVRVDGPRAIQLFLESAELNQDNAFRNEYERIAELYWAGKVVPRDTVKALEYYERYAPLKLNNQNVLAWYLAIIDDPKVRDGKRAIEIERPLVASQPDNGSWVDTLAAAYAASGDFDEAVRLQTRAIELVKKEDWDPEARAGFTHRLELYKAKKAYYQPQP